MNDLDQITRLRPDVPMPGLDELGAVRARLADAIAAESAAAGHDRAGHDGTGRDRAGDDRAGRRVRRLARRPRPRILAAAGALAAVAGLVAALVALPSAGRGAGSSGHATIRLTAAEFLNKAASAVLSQAPPTPPGPNQFVYTETEEANGHKSQTWLSADGLREGRSGNTAIPTCAQYRKQMQQGSLIAPHFYCVAAMQAGYLPDLPTQPGALRSYLKGIGVFAAGSLPPGAPPRWAANDTGKGVDYLMSTTYLLPAQRAALFKLMASTPGFTIVTGVRDAIGRPGLAIRWTYEGGSNEIILSPATYAYLGDRSTSPGESQADYSGAALVKMAIVDHPGERP
jgi:hypothetical protein